jgi:hypothetical protein
MKATGPAVAAVPPTAPDFAAKMSELVQLERGIATLYYYLPDDTLARYAQMRCRALQAQQSLDPGLDRQLHAKEPAFEGWSAVSAAWCSAVWQPDELLPTFGFRVLDVLRAQSDLWSVVVDPRAQFFGLAADKDDRHRYWMVLVVGQKGAGAGIATATAAR